MATHKFSTVDYYGTLFFAGDYESGRTDTLDFGSTFSAASLAFTRTANAEGLRLTAGGRVCVLLDSSRDPTIEQDPPAPPANLMLLELSTLNFSFDDGSQVLFANRANGFRQVLNGTAQDDLLIGTPSAVGLKMQSVDADGDPGNQSSSRGALSADGRLLIFASSATNLRLDEADGGRSDLFLRDLASGKLTLLSTSGGEAWAGAATQPAISADGGIVALRSPASNLGASGDKQVVMIMDLRQGDDPEVRVISVGLDNEDVDSSSSNPCLSGDGQRIAFVSAAENLADNDGNNQTDVFYQDWSSSGDKIKIASLGVDGNAANASSVGASISGNGKLIAYNSDASNLVFGDSNNGRSDIFVHDTETGLNELVSQSQSNQTGRLASYGAVISADGRFVLFQSYDNFGLSNDRNGVIDLYLKDLETKELTIVSTDEDGNARGAEFSSTLGVGGTHSISGNGRFVAFISSNEKLVVADANNSWQELFVKDTVTGRIERIRTLGENDDWRLPDGAYSAPSISEDGSRISFARSADMTAATAVWQTFVVDNPLYRARLAGGDGDDTYQIARTGDTIVETGGAGSGRDTVRSTVTYTLGNNLEDLVLDGHAPINGIGNPVNNVLSGNTGNNRLDGRAGRDTASYANAADYVTVDLRFQHQPQNTHAMGSDTLVAIENLLGSAFNDQLRGDHAANVLNGAFGADVMRGEKGDDIYYVDNGGDLVIEKLNCGTDTVRSQIDYTLTSDVENLVLLGRRAIDGSGNALANLITGNDGANVLNGRDGADVLTGEGGADAFVLASLRGADTVTDFEHGVDRIRVAGAALGIGNKDANVDGAQLRDAPGGFQTSAELVLFVDAISGSFSTAKAAAAIGRALSSYDVGDRAVFAVENARGTALYLFTADDANGAVSADELVLLATVQGDRTDTDDYFFGG